MRLNSFVARSGICSRRKADELIKKGQIKVNFQTVTEPGYRLKPRDIVFWQKRILKPNKPLYILLNKPRGYVCTLSDRYALRKVTDLIPEELGRVFPVGRIDKESRGLLLLTNDGDICFKFTHPRFSVEKEYEVVVEGSIPRNVIFRLRKGVKDSRDLLRPKRVKVLSSSEKQTRLSLVLTTGKKREIRRMFSFFGYKVLDLKRVRIGRLVLGDLKEGEFILLSKKRVLLGLER